VTISSAIHAGDGGEKHPLFCLSLLVSRAVRMKKTNASFRQSRPRSFLPFLLFAPLGPERRRAPLLRSSRTVGDAKQTRWRTDHPLARRCSHRTKGAQSPWRLPQPPAVCCSTVSLRQGGRHDDPLSAVARPPRVFFWLLNVLLRLFLPCSALVLPVSMLTSDLSPSRFPVLFCFENASNFGGERSPRLRLEAADPKALSFSQA